MQTTDIPTRDDHTGPVPPVSARTGGRFARFGAGLWPWFVYVVGALMCVASGVWFFHHRAGGDGRDVLIALSAVLAVCCLGYAAVSARHRRGRPGAGPLSPARPPAGRGRR